MRSVLVFGLAMISGSALGCVSAGTEPQPRTVASINVSVKTEIEIGQVDTATAEARDESGATIPAGSVSWSSTFPDVAVISAESGEIHTQAIGTTEIIATLDGKVGSRRITVLPPPLLINEVNPNGDLPGGWLEIFNSTGSTIDLAGWKITKFTTAPRSESFTFPAGAVIGPGEFVVVDEVTIPGFLNARDGLGLFNKVGAISDLFSWFENAPGTAYARCPDGDRLTSLVSTTTPSRKAANICQTIAVSFNI